MEFPEFTSVLKNSLDARFRPRSGTKNAIFWGVSGPICGRFQLNADFFNTLSPYRHFGE
jgi:hypothetical protein